MGERLRDIDSPEAFESRHSPERLRPRPELAPEEHLHPSDVNVRWYTDTREGRAIRQIPVWLYEQVDLQLRSSCRSCDKRQIKALSILTPLVESVIVSGVSMYSLN